MSRTVASFCLMLALAGMTGASRAAQVEGIRVIEDDAGTRIELSLAGSASDYKYFSLHAPERLVLDLAGGKLAPGFQPPLPTGAVANVRTGRPSASTLRIVFELGQPMPVRSRIDARPGGALLNFELGAPRAAMALAGVTVAPTAAASPSPLEPARAEAKTLEPTMESVAPPLTAVPLPNVVPRPPTRTVQDVIGAGQRELVIAIDAGHGGKDPGALGPSGLHEKQVTLQVARELARQIDADPGMRAVLIRDGDSFVPLQQRYMKARAAQADLFISIHADAALNHNASGASVFVLSTRGASSQAARWLADQENAADLVGGVSLDHKDHNLAAVLLDLSQSATMRASDDVANQVLGALKQVGKAHKPQVERANFVVLRSPDVPSMLVETGFITNPAEEKRLADPGYRQRLAKAIAEGVRNYFSDQPPPGSWYASHQGAGPASRMHVVARGETLSLIAARHGVQVERIREANRRRDDNLRVGEALTIPLVAGAPE